MSKRSFPIPALVGLSLTVGCTPAIMGEWELVEVNGDDVDELYSSTYGSCTLIGGVAGTLSVEEKDGDTYTGEFEIEGTFSTSGDCSAYEGYIDEPEGYSYSADFEATSDDGREFEVELDGDDELQLDCELNDDGDELECTDENDDEYLFERGGED